MSFDNTVCCVLSDVKVSHEYQNDPLPRWQRVVHYRSEQLRSSAVYYRSEPVRPAQGFLYANGANISEFY